MSQVGFGAFRIEASNLSHKQALRQALEQGINLIDTCAIYGNGSSERCIGEVVGELLAEGAITREAIQIVSKVGQLQDELYDRVLGNEAVRSCPPDVVVLHEGAYAFCIHPEYIEQQITESLERMNLAYIDTYLLHNPENYLIWSKLQGTDQGAAQEEMYRRIQKAFAHLEQEVQRGRIKSYGVSSNTMSQPTETYEFLSLERLVQIAKSIAPQHSFSMIQLPFNPLETGAITEPNYPAGLSVIQYAKSAGLAVVVNRPFDAYYENLWMRLTNVDAVDELAVAEVTGLIDEWNDMEEELIGALPFTLSERKSLSMGIYMQQYWQDYLSSMLWEQVWGAFYQPMLESNVTQIRAKETAPAGGWEQRYQEQAQRVATAIQTYYRGKDATRVAALKQAMAEVQQEWMAARTFTQAVIRSLRSTEGIDCVLVGMRRQEYVQDVVEELKSKVACRSTGQEWSKVAATMKQVLA